MSVFLEAHVIQSVPVSNLNRDESGQPKSFVLGGAQRTVISSQSQKYAIRKRFMTDDSVGASCGIRSRAIPDEIIGRVLEKNSSLAPETAVRLVNETITAGNLGTLNLEEKSVYLKSDENEKSRKKKKGEEGTAGKTSSLMMLSYSEIDNIADAIAEKEDSLTLREVREIMTQLPADDIALFGRMFASEKSYTQDAAAQVAFGFSTHEANIQYDYYTAVDDLSAMLGNKAGAAYLDNRPLSTCTMYRYANVNLDALSESLANEQKAIKIAAEFIKAFALTLPNGYQNSCAHHTMPSLIYLTVRTDQPINLMPAFEEPVESDHGYQKASGERLLSYAADLYDNFGNKPAWSVLIGAQNEIAPSKSLPEAIEMMKAEAKSLEKEAHA